MNDAIHNSSTALARYHARAPEDAYLATDFFTAGFAPAALAGIIHAEATFVPQRVEIRARPLHAGRAVALRRLRPLLLPLPDRRRWGGARARRGAARKRRKRETRPCRERLPDRRAF